MAVTLTQILFHVVFSTKHRALLINAQVREELYAFVADTVRRHGGQLVAIGGMPDHVHLLIRLKPYVPVSSMVRFVKTNSSRWLRERPDLARGFAWQTGYAAFTISESQSEAVRTYIRNQEIHHAKRPFGAEVETLLKRHHVSFEPNQLLD
jgi:REP-associated tyrosine transposase